MKDFKEHDEGTRKLMEIFEKAMKCMNNKQNSETNPSSIEYIRDKLQRNEIQPKSNREHRKIYGETSKHNGKHRGHYEKQCKKQKLQYQMSEKHVQSIEKHSKNYEKH